MSDKKLSYELAIELFQHNNFSNAQKKFNQIQHSNKFTESQKLEAFYYTGLCALYLNQPEALSVDKLVEFSNENPTHPKAKFALYYIASNYYQKKNFKKCTEYYNQITLSEFNDELRNKGRFEIAYSYFEQKEYELAETHFDRVKNIGGSYGPAANYYSGYIKVKTNKYDQALTDFQTAEKSKSYASAVPVMITNIYYKQKKYDKIINYATPIVESNRKVTNKKEIIGLLAEAYYQKNIFNKAASFYKLYTNDKRNKREVNFKYGSSAYKTNDFQTATDQFKLVAGTKDSLAQISSYMLGKAYLKLDNKTYALNSFLEASNSDWDKVITKESLYNTGKIQFSEKQYASTIRTFKLLLEQDPNFEKKGEVNNLITESYLNSNNYKEALAYIEALPSPRSDRINKVYQKVTHDQAIKLFNSKKFSLSIKYFEKSQKNDFDKNITIESHFWTAEAYSRLSKWDKSINHYARIFKLDPNKKTPYYFKSLYGIGYGYFNKGEYVKAKTKFENFINSGIISNTSPYYSSALVRIGDCELIKRNFDLARSKFQEAIKLNSAQSAYAKYATGLTYFYQSNDQQAVKYFKEVVSEHTKSIHYGKALFQYSFVNLLLQDTEEAIKGFSKLINEKPQSEIIPQTYYYRAKSYQALDKGIKALADYDVLIKNYCRVTLDGKTSIAEEALAEVSKLAEKEIISSEDYDKRLKKVSSCVPGLDIEFKKFQLAKGKRYELNYNGAITDFKNFLTKYPKSKYITDVQFLLGECYYLTDQFDLALPKFKYVYENAPDSYYLTSVEYLAEMAKSSNNLASVIEYNKIIAKNTNNQSHVLNANLQLLFATYELKRYDETVKYTNEVLKSELTLPHAASEATLFKGKAHYFLNDTLEAKQIFTSTSTNNQDQFGAEAQFYLAKIEQDKGNFIASNDTLSNLNNKFKAQVYWVNQSYLMTGENYEKIGEQFQAISKYKLLVKYSAFDEIKEEAQKRIDRIETEKAKQDSLNIVPDTLEIGE